MTKTRRTTTTTSTPSFVRFPIVLLLIVCSTGLQTFRCNNNVVHAFGVTRKIATTKRTTSTTYRERRISARLNASSSSSIQQTSEQKSRRKELLKRDGPYFKLDRFTGDIEFGAATNLVTDFSKQNPNADKSSIEEWLSDSDGRGLALSIWDESLLEELGNGVYRIQTMPLQFVTLQLQPQVDLQMWTQPPGENRAGRQLPPIFKLQSIGFETNLRLLPGLGITSSESLGIVVEVAGDLRPTTDGTGVTGTISFQTKGILPPPLRILPESVLQLAADTINNTVIQFAVASFEKGAIEKYSEFMKQKTAAAAAAAAEST
jgi:hypothetical protein